MTWKWQRDSKLEKLLRPNQASWQHSPSLFFIAFCFSIPGSIPSLALLLASHFHEPHDRSARQKLNLSACLQRSVSLLIGIWAPLLGHYKQITRTGCCYSRPMLVCYVASRKYAFVLYGKHNLCCCAWWLSCWHAGKHQSEFSVFLDGHSDLWCCAATGCINHMGQDQQAGSHHMWVVILITIKSSNINSNKKY